MEAVEGHSCHWSERMPERGLSRAMGFPRAESDQLGPVGFEDGLDGASPWQLALPLFRCDALNPCSRRIFWPSCEQYWLPLSLWKRQPREGALKAMSIRSARIARSRFMRFLTAQPMTRRECRSRITARYSHPSRVQMGRISPAHFWFDPAAAKPRSGRFGAVWNVWSLSVPRWANDRPDQLLPPPIGPEFSCSFNADPVLPHQPPDPAPLAVCLPTAAGQRHHGFRLAKNRVAFVGKTVPPTVF